MKNENCIFCKIANKEIGTLIYENEYAMSFYDINPMFKTHALVIPKGPYQNILDFVKNAPTNEQAAFWDCFARTADKLGVQCEFNCLANAGADAPFVKQSVFHFHLHLVAGAKTSAFKNLISEIEQ